jgi:hypothetical protein
MVGGYDVRTAARPIHKGIFSGSPKNCAYVMVGPVKSCRKIVCKFRGITLNYAVSQLVNFDLINNTVLNAKETASHRTHREHREENQTKKAEWVISQCHKAVRKSI